MISRLTTARDTVLVLLTISSGAVDAISFLVFGKVFTAFMTGNVVFLGLGAADAFKPGGPNVPRVCVAIAAFAVGAFVAARMIRRARGSRLSAHALALALGGVLLVQLVFLVIWLAVSGVPSSSSATALAAVAALSMGMQSAAIGSLELKAVFTTAVTATLINLAREPADPGSTGTDPARMARILVSLVVGATVGGLLLVHARTYAGVVPPLVTAVAIALTLLAQSRAAKGLASTNGVVKPLTPKPAVPDAEVA